ncbi:Uncharacterized protein LW93_9337 [Fusarium fujikuroi]|nr:Uncharacterized protein LW93_9337 [Fusarium fujikuroi]
MSTFVELKPGQAQFLSSFKPSLTPGDYTVKVKQEVSLDGEGNKTLRTDKKFKVEGPSQYQLPAGSIHSIYPGEGESVPSKVLPQVTLNDPHIPWELSPDNGQKIANGYLDGSLIPWLALLVFTEDEVKTLPTMEARPAPSPTLSVRLTKRQLKELKSTSTQVPLSSQDLDTNADDGINTVFVNSSAFRAYFSRQMGDSEVEPAIARYSYLSHIRRSRSTKPRDSTTDTFSVALGHRSGPLGMESPTTAYAHLVSLMGVSDLNMPGQSDLTALISLYSWSFTWTKGNDGNIKSVIETISNNVRPLARIVEPSADQWLRRRLEAGYTIVKHRIQTGEQTAALFRGPLIPQQPRGNELDNAEESGHGSGLQIIDKTTGIIDITYSAAWSLGRSLAIESSSFTMAISTLRNKIAQLQRTDSSAAFLGGNSGVPQENILPGWYEKLKQISKGEVDSKAALATEPGSRWKRARESLDRPNFETSMPGSDAEKDGEAVRKFLQKEVDILVDDKDWYARELAEPTQEGLYLAKVLDFVYNQLLTLQAVPHNYMFPEPDILDTEAIFTFHVDPLWVDTLVDGALSIGSHSTVNHDYTRNKIKWAINLYLRKVELRYKHPRIPRWGAIICGDKIQELSITVTEDQADAGRENSLEPFQLSLKTRADESTNLTAMKVAGLKPSTGSIKLGFRVFNEKKEALAARSIVAESSAKATHFSASTTSSIQELPHDTHASTITTSCRVLKQYSLDNGTRVVDLVVALNPAQAEPLSGDNFQRINVSFPLAELVDTKAVTPPRVTLFGQDSARWVSGSAYVTGDKPCFTVKLRPRAPELAKKVNFGFLLSNVVLSDNVSDDVLPDRKFQVQRNSIAMIKNWYEPDGFDAKDNPYVYSGPPKDRNDLTSISLLGSGSDALKRYTTPTEIPVLDAVCAAFRFLAYSGDNGHLVTEPSRRFIYYNARALTKMDDENNHTQWPGRVYNRSVGIREALRAVTVYGASLESRSSWVVEEDFDYGHDVAWAINERPTDLAYNEASKGPILEPYRLDHYRIPEEVKNMDDLELKALGTLTLSKVRSCIAEGYPVIFAFHLFWDSFRYVEPAQSGDEGYPTIAMIPAARRLAGPQKEHTTQAALIVAFDHIKRRVLVQSMMKSVSFFWMSYEWIIDARATESFWMLRNSGKRGRQEIVNSSDGTWYDWEDMGPWNLKRIPDSWAVSQLPNSSIAVISRQEGHLDIFWISEHCTVERAYREPLDSEWKRETVPLNFPPGDQKDQEAKVPLPGAIVAVSAHVDKLDIFWMSKNGAICNGSWQHTEPKWYTRRVLQNQDGVAEPRAGLAATIGQRDTPSGDKINIYCVGPNGSIRNIATTRSWSGTDTVTIVSGPGTAYQYTSLSAVAVDNYGGGDSSARLMESLAWITPDRSITGKQLAKDTSWVDIWEEKGQANIVRQGSHISTTYSIVDSGILLDFFYANPQGKLSSDFAYFEFDDSTPYQHINKDIGTKEEEMVQEHSDIKSVSWKQDGKWTGLVLWQNQGSKVLMNRTGAAANPIQLNDNRVVRRGSPFGFDLYGGKPVMAMKLDDGFIGVGYWGGLNF